MDQVKDFIKVFRQLLPKGSVLKVFILLDADLKARHDPDSPLQKEKAAYQNLGQKNPNVQIYYHCWDGREWENWLLFNTELLRDMLIDPAMGQFPAIQELREKMQAKSEQSPTNKEEFHKWFIDEVERHAKYLYDHKLTPVEFGFGTEKQSIAGSKEQAGRAYLERKGIDPKVFGDAEKYILSVLGGYAQNQKPNDERKGEQL